MPNLGACFSPTLMTTFLEQTLSARGVLKLQAIYNYDSIVWTKLPLDLGEHMPYIGRLFTEFNEGLALQFLLSDKQL